MPLLPALGCPASSTHQDPNEGVATTFSVKLNRETTGRLFDLANVFRFVGAIVFMYHAVQTVVDHKRSVPLLLFSILQWLDAVLRYPHSARDKVLARTTLVFALVWSAAIAVYAAALWGWAGGAAAAAVAVTATAVLFAGSAPICA